MRTKNTSQQEKQKTENLQKKNSISEESLETNERLNNNYNKMIKKRLEDWLTNLINQGFELNFGVLCENMKNLYHIQTSEQKLRQMFSTANDREVKLPELVALTHMLHIPLAKLCEFPNVPAIAPNIIEECPWIYSREKQYPSTRISKLMDHFYNGTYYAYYFKPKHLDRIDLGGKTPITGLNIEEAKIEIQMENGESYVIFEELSCTRNFFDTKELDRFTLKGKLYLIESPKIAYSFITDPEGRRAIALMFEYKEFNKDILYYRTAAMLTFSLNELHIPLFQKIALFRVKQDLSDQENANIIRGILALNTGSIMIEHNVFQEAQEKNPKLKDLIPKEEKNYYFFSEPAIRDSIQNWDSDESVKILLKLRELSNFQAHEIITEPEYFSTFIRHYQTNHKNFPSTIQSQLPTT